MKRTSLVKVKNWVSSQANPKSFNVQKLRDALVGNVMTSTFGEVCAYRLMLEDVRGGELPSYVPVLAPLLPTPRSWYKIHVTSARDNATSVAVSIVAFFIMLMSLKSFKNILIVAMSALEAIATPFLSWLGFRKRRFVLVFYTMIALLCTLSWYFLPSAAMKHESELCDSAISINDIRYQGMSVRSILRLTVIIMGTLAFQLSRVTTWTHGLAYCDEFAPERISVHYGALLLGRVVILVIGNRLVMELVEDLLPVQISLLVLGYLYNLIKFLCVVPKNAPEVNGIQKTALPLDGRGFLLSMSRVVSQSLVLALALAASLLVAALWNVGYNEEDIVRVKFLMPLKSKSVDLVLRHLFIVMPIALAGVKFSAPLLLDYCRKKALKQAIVTTTFAFIFFILLTVLPKCDQGSVAGLGDYYYNKPECSLSCGCKPTWTEFNPVCVTDNMTTFLSPCHAGCSGTEHINGIQVYKGCRCAGYAGAGSAILGACATDCKEQYILHDMLFIVATTFSLLALQAQGVLILKVVDPRDRSVAMGLLLAVVTVVTFVCGHLMFLAIRVATCRWYEGGQCHLQTAIFPYVVGFCSSFFVLLSAVISIASLIFTRTCDRNRLCDTRL